MTKHGVHRHIARFFLLASLWIPATSFATSLKVFAFNPACGYVLAQSNSGFLLLKQQGNSTYLPAKDDIVDGAQVENFGISYIRNVATGAALWVYHDSNGWLDTQTATALYEQHCGPLPKPPAPEPAPLPDTKPPTKPAS